MTNSVWDEQDLRLERWAEAFARFLEWQKEYDFVNSSRYEEDGARRLMHLLGIPVNKASVLIGGSNCPLFQRAIDRIRQLEVALEGDDSDLSERERVVSAAESELETLRHNNAVLKLNIDSAIRQLAHTVGPFRRSAGKDPHPLDCTLAGRVSHVFQTGMTRSIQMCRDAGMDPNYQEGT